MALIQGPEKIRVLNLREDYQIETLMLPVEEYASDVITRKKNNKRDKSWLLPHQLLKRCYNVPGIPNGAKALITTPRDVVFDPLNQLDDSWSKDKIKARMGEIAKEQQHKAEGNKSNSVTNVTMILLSSAVVILVLAIAAIGLMNYYGG